VPFQGGLTIGYWKTHTGLAKPPRDGTYDYLPVFLGIPPVNGAPEQSVDNETEAFIVFSGANGSGLGVGMLKAQLLAAKLNALQFPGFENAFLPNGQTVGDVIGDADQILDDLANGIPHEKAEVTHVKDLLDAANNNSHDQVLETCPHTVALESVPGDYDGDGFDDERESGLIGTNSVKPCGTGGWPADLVDGGREQGHAPGCDELRRARHALEHPARQRELRRQMGPGGQRVRPCHQPPGRDGIDCGAHCAPTDDGGRADLRPRLPVQPVAGEDAAITRRRKGLRRRVCVGDTAGAIRQKGALMELTAINYSAGDGKRGSR
jgi:hypothetical protein